MKDSLVVSIVMVVVSVSACVWIEIISTGEFDQTVVECFSLSKWTNFVELPVIDVLEFKDCGCLSIFVEMTGNHGKMGKVNVGSPPDVVNSTGQIRK